MLSPAWHSSKTANGPQKQGLQISGHLSVVKQEDKSLMFGEESMLVAAAGCRQAQLTSDPVHHSPILKALKFVLPTYFFCWGLNAIAPSSLPLLWLSFHSLSRLEVYKGTNTHYLSVLARIFRYPNHQEGECSSYTYSALLYKQHNNNAVLHGVW